MNVAPDGGKKRGTKVRAATFQGKPCRACGSPERYAKSGNCVACERARSLLKYHNSIPYWQITVYGIPQEFTRWVTAPALEITV